MQQAIIACKALQPAVEGACREIEPEALARLVGWKVTPRRSRCGCAARIAGRKLPRWWRLGGPDRAEYVVSSRLRLSRCFADRLPRL